MSDLDVEQEIQKLAFPNVPDNIKQIAKLCHNVNKA